MNSIKELEAYFRRLRFDERHHLGLGDIRLSMGQQEEIIEMLLEDMEREKNSHELKNRLDIY